MSQVLDPIVIQVLGAVEQDSRHDALLGWDWLASKAEQVIGERPVSQEERIPFWLKRLSEEGMSAFGLHADVALAFFASVGHTEAVSGIISAAQDESDPMNKRWVGESADHLANKALALSAYGCTDGRAVELLMQMQVKGLFLNLPDSSGETPLHVACAAGRRGLVQALLACGADPNVVNEEGKTPLHYLASSPVWKDTLAKMENKGNVITDLLIAGARLDLMDQSGVDTLEALKKAGWPSQALNDTAKSLVVNPRSRGIGSSRCN